MVDKQNPKHAQPNLQLKTVGVDSIDPPLHARRVDQAHVEKLASSIEIYGLFQRIGVILEGERYRNVWGNSRLHAHRLLGRKEIDVVVLPPETTTADELAFSIQENALRKDEHFEDVLLRVEQHARFSECSLTKAAERNGIGKTQLSKIRRLDSDLSDEVKRLAREHKVGVSVLYEICQEAHPDKQLEYLKANVARKMTRDDISKAIRRSKGTTASSLALKTILDGSPVQLSVPSDCDYDRLSQLLGILKAKLQQYRKQDIALGCLPEIFARQGAK